MSEQRVKVAIAGGGIAGLALAAGLAKKPHLDVHVYESVPAYRDVGAGLALHLNGIKAMSLIGPEVRQAYADKALSLGDEEREMATEVILAHGRFRGQKVAELGRAKGRKTVSRADLLDGFLALIPPGRVSFGRRLVGIEERRSGEHRVRLTFEDGTEAAADCLLGADGIHSVTRGYLLGPDHPAAAPVNHDGWQIYRTMVPTEEAVKQIDPRWTTTVPILLGPRGHVNCIPLNKNTRLSAGVAVRGAVFSAVDGSAPPLDPALFTEYSEEAQKIVRMVAKDTSASWTAADHDHAPFYARGRVAMFGDAAHAALPFAGNGAAQALEDAAVLDRLFAHVDSPKQIAAALEAFDAVRRPRSQAVVDLARKFGRVYAYAEEGRMHEDPARMKQFFGEMAAFTNEFDVAAQSERAYNLFVTDYQRGQSEEQDI
ncbi:FAD/NAD(P)-binding domain-containing protein [Hypoxylon rubiginosum]|uniref:FAD/NAD(P)-binding domain-containing protein n=1 Tax=Hypoxylon rubiginosum TaxID=110542 RepID=A0ACB9YW85_9PEZI|nr:FAD/NAD(P)-binding domain-containing protein [Hypoxylon rubiginosum]